MAYRLLNKKSEWNLIHKIVEQNKSAASNFDPGASSNINAKLYWILWIQHDALYTQTHIERIDRISSCYGEQEFRTISKYFTWVLQLMQYNWRKLIYENQIVITTICTRICFMEFSVLLAMRFAFIFILFTQHFQVVSFQCIYYTLATKHMQYQFSLKYANIEGATIGSLTNRRKCTGSELDGW